MSSGSVTPTATEVPEATTNPFELPPELWISIFDSLRKTVDWDSSRLVRTPQPDKASLLSLSLTCRMFYRLAEPFFYERVSLKQDNQSIVKVFLDLVDERPERLRWIKYLSLRGWDLADADYPVEALEPRVINLFLSIEYLEAVRLTRIFATKSMYARLFTMPKLEAFASFQLMFREDPRSPDLKTSDLKLRTVIIREARTWIKHRPECLAVAELTLSPALKRLVHGTSFAPFVQEMMKDSIESKRGYQALEELDVNHLNARDIVGLFATARCCPKVTTLNASPRTSSQADTIPDPLPEPTSDLFPALGTLSGPAWLVGKLVPGRPVKHAIMRGLGKDSEGDKEAVKRLGFGSAGLKKLRLEVQSTADCHLEHLGDTIFDLDAFVVEFPKFGVAETPSTPSPPEESSTTDKPEHELPLPRLLTKIRLYPKTLADIEKQRLRDMVSSANPPLWEIAGVQKSYVQDKKVKEDAE